MAVVSKVPTEVLSEIFYLLCQRPISICELNNSQCTQDFPWAVGLVCRQWRIAFLSYPPIWASLTLSDSHFYLVNHDVGDQPYANEINRRLGLYLERSREYPLNIIIFLWAHRNTPDTTTALKMLVACSHRWRALDFDLLNKFHMDCMGACRGKLPVLESLKIQETSLPIRGHYLDLFEVAPRLTCADVGPWAKRYGWILPWTQMTELSLTLDDLQDDDVPTILPMLQNIKELHLCFSYDELEFEGGFPQFTPVPLKQLRVLEVPHPAILSWFETQSLTDLYFADYQQENDEPLDVRGQVTSLVKRSGCKIRKLSLSSGRKFYVGMQKDVEELEIEYIHTSSGIGYPPIDISSLPNLRFLNIICLIDEDIKTLTKSLTTALKSARMRSRGMPSANAPGISYLERVTVELHHNKEQPQIPKKLLEIARKWPQVVFRTKRL